MTIVIPLKKIILRFINILFLEYVRIHFESLISIIISTNFRKSSVQSVCDINGSELRVTTNCCGSKSAYRLQFDNNKYSHFVQLVDPRVCAIDNRRIC